MLGGHSWNTFCVKVQTNHGWPGGAVAVATRGVLCRGVRVTRHFVCMPRAGNPSVRDWCFTVFADVLEDRSGERLGERLRTCLAGSVETGECVYWCFQLERCPETERVHVQGFVRWKRTKRRLGCKASLGEGTAHVEPRNGTPEQARDYCRKQDSRVGGPWEGGAWRSQGERSDLEEVRRAIERGDPELAVASRWFGQWCRYSQAFDRYRDMLAVRRTSAPDVRVYWGASGCGKSRRAWDEFPDLYAVPVPARRSAAWFDGYSGQDAVLIDDFLGNEYDIGFLLKLLDRYPLRVPVKGSFRNWRPAVIIITSNVDPRDWYPEASVESRAALRRRITSITHFAVLT